MMIEFDDLYFLNLCFYSKRYPLKKDYSEEDAKHMMELVALHRRGFYRKVTDDRI